MKRFVGLGGLGLLLWCTGCNCGGVPLGGVCANDAECQSGVCGADKRCASAGGGGGDAGGADGGDGGTGVLPDGGLCEGLQCQVVTCPSGGSTTVTGKVYDPAGNVPLYNAVVFVPNKPLAAFTAGPSCAGCNALISGAPVALAITGPDGAFTLTNVPSGANIPLVVQVGKWRRQVTLPSVTACQANPLIDANITRLPRNKSEGDLPQIAISTGNADAFECLLKKIGISDSEVTVPTGDGRVHFYQENGLDLSGGAPAGSTLWTTGATLKAYDVVILPCEGAANAKTPAAVANLVAYANSGGRVFATHYSYVWTRVGWPQAADWRPKLPDLYNQTFNVTVDQSFPKGQAFAQWLSNVGASTTPGTLGVEESRHDVVAVRPGSTRWLYGTVPASSPPESVQHLTYNTPFSAVSTLPDGGAVPACGRVVYSDFHVTAGAKSGGNTFPTACVAGAMTGQEKALEFMLFDLSACVQDDHFAPTACAVQNQTCKQDADCCSGLACLNAALAPCAGGTGCTCVSTIN